MRSLPIAALAALALAAPAQAETAKGGLTADLLTSRGTLVGHLRANVAAGGEGLGTIRSEAGRRLADRVVSVRVGRGGGVRVVGPEVRLRARLRGTLLKGRGRAGGRRVRVHGVGRDRLPELRRGMKMLVVGHPRGEGYRALRRVFRPVSYDRFRDRPERFRRHRHAFHRFAAIVFGDSPPASRIRTHPLLRTFYDAGKWVVIAPADARAGAALQDIHPYVRGNATRALAVRSTGPAGSFDRVKVTLAYPDARRGQTRPSRAVQRRLARERARWFRGRLAHLGRATMSSAGGSGAGAHAAQGSGGAPAFELPFNAAAIEIAVPYFHQLAFSDPATLNLALCGWDYKRSLAYCPGTAQYEQAAGDGGVAQACQYYHGNGMRMVAESDVKAPSNLATLNSDGSYRFVEGDFVSAYVSGPRYECPAQGSQTGALQGNDYYYAIYDPGFDYHTIIALTDPTVSAASTAKPWSVNAKNGTGELWSLTNCNDDDQCSYDTDDMAFEETAWFLADYVHELDLTGANVGDANLEYSGNQSFPNNQITFDQDTKSVSESQSFSIGIFGDQGQGSYTNSQTRSESVTIAVPDWQITPAPGAQSITYDWATNTPTPWAQISQSFTNQGIGASHELNDLNVSDFSPSSLTAWTGQATWGPISIAATRTLTFADHYVTWDTEYDRIDEFELTPMTFTDGPNSTTPVTKNAKLPGIDLCDPAVAAPGFKTQCAG